MLRRLKVQVSYQIQQFYCETGISSLGFTSPQSLPSRWHEQSIMKPIMGGTSINSHSGVVCNTSFWCPHSPSIWLCYPFASVDTKFGLLLLRGGSQWLFLNSWAADRIYPSQDVSFSTYCKQWKGLVVPSVLTEIPWGKRVSAFVTLESFQLSSVHPGLLFCLVFRDCTKLFLAREVPEFIRNISVLIDFVSMTNFRKEYRGFSASIPTYFW